MAWKNQPSAFSRRADFDDAPLVPVGLGELAQLLNAIDDLLQDAAVPAARLAVAADAVLRVPRGRRPPTASWPSRPTSVMSRSPSRFFDAPRGSYGLRSACGPAARIGARASAVWERRSVRDGESRSRRDVIFRFSPLSDSATLAFSHRSTICSGVPAATTCPPPSPASGPEVDDPVAALDDVEVVLDDDDRVAQIDQPAEHVEQLGEVVEVQAGRRLVEQVERAAGVGPRQLGGQLDALGLAAGERRGRLAERRGSRGRRRTASAGCGESWGCCRTASTRVAAGHVQHVGDRLAVERDGQRLGVVALAAAGRRTRPTRRAGSASRSASGRSLRRPRSGRPAR